MAHLYSETTGPGYAWIESGNGFVPDGSVAGGEDINGETIFVGRAVHAGETIPGKVVPSHGVCYVAHGGGEHAHSQYQVLVSHDRVKWKRAADGQVRKRALEAGRTVDDESLFVGRTYHEGSLVIGKVHPSHGALYFPFNCTENRADSYEVLRFKKH